MDASRWRRIQQLFHEVADLPAHARRTVLIERCGDDTELIAQVEHLIEEDSAADRLFDGGVSQAAAELLGGLAAMAEQFGPYRVTRVLGEGGTSLVLLAERTDIGGQVAIKVLRDAWISPARRERFAAEQRILAELTHESIAQIHDAGALADGTPWFVMEYVEGLPLTEYCRQHATSIEGRLELLAAVCAAVQYAHEHAVIHRDIKPSNVLVKPGGAVKLLDFGIAKHLTAPEATIEQTRTGMRMMTPAYASPEQIRGHAVGVRTDVYSLGVLAYELVAGRAPFDLQNLTPAEAISKVASSVPERPSAVNRRLSIDERPVARTLRISWSDLDVLCLCAMHQDPQRRYATVEALKTDVDRFLAAMPLQARPDTLGYRARKLFQRARTAVIVTLAVLIAISGLIGFYTVRLARARDAAEAEAERAQRIQRFMIDLFDVENEPTPVDELAVMTLVNRSEQDAQALDADPATQAELYVTLASVYQRLGEFDHADRLLIHALERRRALFGERHADVGNTQIALALLRSDQAQLDQARELAEQGLATLERAHHAGHPQVSLALAALGHVMVEQGDYDAAIAVLQRAETQQSAGAGQRGLSRTLHELSNAHFYKGDYEQAETIAQRMLALDRETFGEAHPHIADDLVNLGAIEHERGRYSDAEQHYRNALVIAEEVFGPDHHRTASVQTMLGRSLVYQKRYDEAEALLERAHATQQRVFGSNHPRVASAVNDLGSVALQRNDPATAAEHFGQMVDIYAQALPESHYLHGIARSNLASAQMARENYASAETLYREAIEIFEISQGEDHPNVAIARIKLGRCLLRQGQHEQAEIELRTGHDALAARADSSVSWLQSAREDLDELTRLRASSPSRDR